MRAIQRASTVDLIDTVTIELAKSINEIKDAQFKLDRSQSDIKKAKGRIGFLLAIAEELKARNKID